MPQDNGRKRIIGKYDQGMPGPLLIVIGGVHGNEPAGVKAIEQVFRMLDEELLKTPDFCFKGTIIGLKGNSNALSENVRYIDRDLNRIWFHKDIKQWQMATATQDFAEAIDATEILDCINNACDQYNPPQLIILDLHTTSSGDGIFAIPVESDHSVTLAYQLHAPLVFGLLNDVSGTLMSYFSTSYERTPTTVVCFEGGQHNDPLSINRCIAAIINTLRSCNMVDSEVVENVHDQLLVNYSRGLPRSTHLVYRHRIASDDGFVMLPGFKNLQPISKGQLLAHDRQGEVRAQYDGYILMPLYQSMGSEGFFIVQEKRE